MILLIDNYDSFTFNLDQFLGDLGAEVEVRRNDAIASQDALAMRPEAIVLSPGPCTPNEAGICLPLIGAAAAARVPLLGVCLGHQAIGQAFGGEVVRAPEPVHGKVWGSATTAPTSSPACPTRSRPRDTTPSWCAGKTLPAELEVTASTADGLVMGLAHRALPIWGVQFHPESIASQHGHDLLRNFLTLAARAPAVAAEASA